MSGETPLTDAGEDQEKVLDPRVESLAIPLARDYAEKNYPKREDGTFEPAWRGVNGEKALKNKSPEDLIAEGYSELAAHEVVIDIANQPYNEYSEYWKEQNRGGAEFLIGLMDERGADAISALDLEDEEVRAEFGDLIHENWISRNEWVKDPNYGDPKLACSFAKLSPEEQQKDIDQLAVLQRWIKESPGPDESMGGVAIFDAEAARKLTQQFIEEKKRREQKAIIEKQKEQERLEKEREERRNAEKAEAERKQHEHELAWEKQKEEFDYSGEITTAFIVGINGMIKEASNKGEESIDLTKDLRIDYGPHGDFTRESKGSVLTGREIGEGAHYLDAERKQCDSLVDSVIEKSSDGKEFDKEIRDIGVELMSQIASKYRESGFRVQLDEETGVVASISWGETLEPEPTPQQPTKKSGRWRIGSLFGKR